MRMRRVYVIIATAMGAIYIFTVATPAWLKRRKRLLMEEE
jgi:hypothetical protein